MRFLSASSVVQARTSVCVSSCVPEVEVSQRQKMEIFTCVTLVYHRQAHFSDMSMVDRVARCIFPTTSFLHPAGSHKVVARAGARAHYPVCECFHSGHDTLPQRRHSTLLLNL